jgi:ADP-ribose pyrophosphatase
MHFRHPDAKAAMNDATHDIPADARAPVETLFEGRWLSLRKRGRWEYAERNNPSGAVIILAVTPADKVLFVEQYRVSILQNTIEMPAGLIGDLADQTDENALMAAQRELEEETGYRCRRVEFVHCGPSSSGMSTEMITFVRAWDLEHVGPGGGDETENIVVHEVPRGEAGAWLFARAAEGYSIDPKLFAGLWFIEHMDPRPA